MMYSLKGKYVKLLILILFVIVAIKLFFYFNLYHKVVKQNSEQITNKFFDNVQISVYYEALCPDSKEFIAQVQSVYHRFNKYVTLDLVPYGKAKTIEVDGQLTFQCQHGETECYANKIHACSIHLINDNMVLIDYISCMISDNIIPDYAEEKCGKDSDKIDYVSIKRCANGKTGNIYLKEYGIRTDSLQPPITFVPTIELNGNQDFIPQRSILQNLTIAICTILGDSKPDIC